MRKQPELTSQTKENLKKAFWKLYAKKGIEKISVKEITDLAGYNRGTFYLYYKDIYHLVDEAETDLLEKMIRQIESGEAGSAEEMLDTLRQSYEKYKKYLDILHGAHGDPAFIGKLKDKMKELARPKLKALDIMDEAVIELFLEYHVAGSIALIQHCVAQKKEIPVQEILDLIRCFETFYVMIKKENNQEHKSNSTKFPNC